MHDKEASFEDSITVHSHHIFKKNLVQTRSTFREFRRLKEKTVSQTLAPMTYKILLLSSILSIICNCIHAQPDEAYINQLVGPIDQQWLKTSGEAAPSQQLNWSSKTVQGFQQPDPHQRLQAQLSQPWTFYEVHSDHNPAKSTEVSLPHQFPRERDYKSGWFVTNYHLDEQPEKRLILMLNRVDLFSLVYVNGERIGHHFGSYTPFEFDITDAVVSGKNTLAIFVSDRSAAVDGDKTYNQLGPAWLKSSYSQGRADTILPGGIEEIPVLELRENASIQDIFVKTSTRKDEMEIEYELTIHGKNPEPSKLSFELLNWENGEKVDLDIPEILVTQTPTGVNSCRVKWSNPTLWSPDQPHLYVLRTTLRNGSSTDILDTRFGFREFWVEGKRFMLNGVPTRLRGESTYRPFRHGNESHKEIFTRYKEMFGINACRIHAFMPPGDIMLAADEAGVLLINQSAIWSVNVQFYKKGGDWFLKNTEKEYEEWVRRDRNCPSVVIWDVENEMLRYNYEEHLPWVSQLPAFIEKFDTTRPFNFSGAGWFSADQDMASLHMQEHYTRIMSDWKDKGTYPLLMGEFWVGGRMEQRIPTSPEFTSVNERFINEGEIYQEKLLEMRQMGVTGIMPFRISLLAFQRERSSGNLIVSTRPEEATAKIKHALQPATLFFWPRQTYVAAKENIQRELIICNDGEAADRYNIAFKWENESAKSYTIDLNPGEQKRIKIEEEIPTGSLRMIATMENDQGLIATDELKINTIPRPQKNFPKKIQVFNHEELAKNLTTAGIQSSSSIEIPQPGEQVILIIPEHASNRELKLQKESILSFLDAGGTVLSLKQDQAPSWFPMKFQFWSANQTSPHTYERMGWEGLHKNLFYSKNAPSLAPSHPIFADLADQDLHLWDPFDGRVSDDVFVRPSNIKKYEQGNWRPLANGTRREHVSLAELFYGKGTLLSCQLNIIENLQNPQAKVLLCNMLQYLSNKQPNTFDKNLKVEGKFTAKDLSQLTGVSESVFDGASAEEKDVMFAFDGTKVSQIKNWAKKGGTVIVFSKKLSSTFEGVQISPHPSTHYLATKVSGHPIFDGVASTNFMNLEKPVIQSHFTQIPEQSKVIFQGFSGTDFWRMKDAGPVLINLPYGDGEIMLSTIEIDRNADASIREFLSLVLTNCNVSIPFENKSSDQITIKKTVPITIDGKLNEWLEDMEDRNVTPYIHAQPVYLTSESIVEGPPEFDLNLSSINYFLWNEQALYIAGVVFGEEKTYETGIGYGSKKHYQEEIRFNDEVINITVKNNQAEVFLNGELLSNRFVKTSKMDSKNMTDATLLEFNHIQASGKIASVDSLIGDTFELMIPWERLKNPSSQENAKLMIGLSSKGSKIQVPSTATSNDQQTWLSARFDHTSK